MSNNKPLERAEVIAALRFCANRANGWNCDACPGFEAICAQEKQIRLVAADLIEQLTTEPPNDPLTLEELRGMDGEPVWVVFEPDADADRLTMWALVDVTDDEVELRNNLGGHSALQDGMAVEWNRVDIYRRKPEGGGE